MAEAAFDAVALPVVDRVEGWRSAAALLRPRHRSSINTAILTAEHAGADVAADQQLEELAHSRATEARRHNAGWADEVAAVLARYSRPS